MIISAETPSNEVCEDIRTQPRPKCILCNTKGERLLSGLKGMVNGLPGNWDVSRCSNPGCGLVWLDPMPVREDIGKLYEVYYTHGQTLTPAPLSPKGRLIQAVMWGYIRMVMGYRQGVGPVWYGLLWPIAYTHRAGSIASQGTCFYLPAPKNGNRLLEVGFGSGERLDLFSRMGWQVEGVEMDAVVVEKAKANGFNVRQGELHQQKYDSNSFDAIIMNHVLEHVYDPIEFFKECRRILRPGGKLVACQPNVDSMCCKHFKEHWLGWSLPHHLFMYRPNSLRKLAEVSGLKVERLFTAATVASDWYRECEAFKVGCKTAEVHIIRGMAFQLAQRLRSWFDPTVGEELVLVAGKFSDA